VGRAGAVANKVAAEKWCEDLRHFSAVEMESRHKNLFHTASHE
jgi:hypothetical protein